MNRSKAFSLYDKWIMIIVSLAVIGGLATGWLTQEYYWFALPFALLLFYITLNDIRFIFYLLLFTLPFSFEFSFSSSLATDLPSEPLIIGLMLVFIFSWLMNKKTVEKNFIIHPLFSLLLLHFIWIIVTVIYSSNHIVSVKFLLAKTWYLVVFLLLAGSVLKEIKDVKKFFWCLIIPTVVTVIYTIIRHAAHGFSFATVNTMMEPFYRNHVVYAAFVAQLIPLTWLAASWYKKRSFTRFTLRMTLLLMIVAVFLSYTRSAWLSVLIIIPAVFIIRHKWMGKTLLAGTIGILGFVFFMAWQNHYLEFAPNYQETIMHEDLKDHLIATYEMQDISSAERVFRWIAGFRMWQSNPVVGYGPGNFYNFYKPYAIPSFATYVSENTERSTVHNYFLLLLVEQGIVGLIIFSIFTASLLIYGQRIYHQLQDKQLKQLAVVLTVSLLVIYVNTFLSDLIETVKVGSLYFIFVAMLINLDIKSRVKLIPAI